MVRHVVLSMALAVVAGASHTSAADVVISEIMYHPNSYLEEDEFLEIHNTSGVAVDLSGWYFDGVEWVFGAGQSIPPDGFLVVAVNAANFQGTYGFAPDGIYTGRLDNGGELLQLYDSTGLLVDQVSFQDLAPWAITPDGEGPSLEVIDPLEDNDTPRNWRASTHANGHTAGAVNSVNATGLPPWIAAVAHTVDPDPNDPILVTAEVLDATAVNLTFFTGFTENVGEMVIDEGDLWRYFKGVAPPSDPIEAWTEIAFDDSSWQTGNSGFGYGDGDDATDLNQDPMPPTAMEGEYASVYIRHLFPVPHPDAVAALMLSVDYDDAFVAYINGVEVARSDNISGDPPLFDSVAESGHEASGGDPNPQPPDLIDVSSIVPLLVPGPNVLAVQGHNLAVDNNDFSLIPELSMVPGLSMFDDGLHGDGTAGDGVYGAWIPGQLANTLVRYSIEAIGPTGLGSYPRTDDTVSYDGTVVADPTVSSALPVIQWFMHPDDFAAALSHRYTNETEPAILYYNGVLFDNSRARIRGGASRGWAKANWKFLLPRGHKLYDEDLLEVPVDQFCVQGNYADKSYTRTILGYETFREAGAQYCQAFPVRLHQNGAFYGLYTYMESFDADYIKRHGMDTDGAWYKTSESTACNCRQASLGALPSCYVKKQRLQEDHSDLYYFLYDLNTLSGQDKKNFLFANVDIPSVINYIAAHVLIHHTDRSWHNYFLYRDSDGTQRWSKQAYDMDLTLGRNACPLFNDDPYGNRDPVSHPLVNHANYADCFNVINHFTHAMLDDPHIREMYFRRLRTVMDKILAPGFYESRLAELEAAMSPEAALDAARWGQYGQSQSLGMAIDILENTYLAQRRQHLFVTHRTTGEIPQAQSDHPPIIMNEIMYHPLTGGDHEFLELYNPSPTEAVDLTDWRIDGLRLRLPAGVVILPQDYLVVVRADVQFRSTYGSSHFVAAEYDGALDNAGECVSLLDATGTVIDEVCYDDVVPWPTTPDGGGSSLELIDRSRDNNRASNWASSSVAGGTPDSLNSVVGSVDAYPEIYINEILPVNGAAASDEMGDFDPWIEIYNAGTATVDLGGMFLTDDYLVPDKWEIPEETELCGRYWLTIWADNEPGEGDLHTNFLLGGAGGSVALYSDSGVLVDAVNYPTLSSDVSQGRLPDGGSFLRKFPSPTPDAGNSADPTAVLLNEYNAVRVDRYLENNGADVFWGEVQGNGGDWFELVVSSDHADLRGWTLVMTDKTGDAEEATYTLTLTGDPLWSDVRAGSIITVAEELTTDVSYDPAGGDWWINVQASDSASGTYITAQDFDVSNQDWQLTILDGDSAVVFGPAGEGVNPLAGVGSDEVFKLEENPSQSITQFSNYNDGSSSTFGAPNRWSAGSTTQDFSSLRRLVSCEDDTDCADGNPCTDDACNANLCEYASNAATCDDRDPCTENDACSAGQCGGVPVANCCQVDCACDDGNACTAGVCSENACQFTPLGDGADCNDGDLCTTGDACIGGVCEGGALDCTFLTDDCNTGFCGPTTGTCFPSPSNEGGDCDDGRTCTLDDVCYVGRCVGSDDCGANRACDWGTDACEDVPSASALPIRSGDVWRFLKGTQEPPADWVSLPFDDSAWFSGQSGLGFGDGDDVTDLPDMQGNYITLYARRLFHVSNPSLVIGMTLTVDYDDGFVAYLNGHEVARGNMTAYPAAFDSPAADEHEASGGSGNPNPPQVVDLIVFTTLLRPGSNVLAIQGHNSYLTSDDFSLIPELDVALYSPAPTVDAVGGRYLAITPPAGQPSVAIEVDSADIACLPQYVDPAGYLVESPVFQASDDWGSVYVGDAEIVPDTLYSVRADVRDATEPENLSDPVLATTWLWGDTTGTNGVNVFDIVCVLDGFNEIFSNCSLYANDLNHAVPDRSVDVFDIVGVLDGFRDLTYARSPCPAAFADAGTATEAADVAADGAVILVPRSPMVRAGEQLIVDIFASGIAELRAYEIALEVRPSDARQVRRLTDAPVAVLESIGVDVARKDYVFDGLMSYPVVNVSRGRLAGASLEASVDIADRVYLGTYTYRISEQLSGTAVRVDSNPEFEPVLLDSESRIMRDISVLRADVRVLRRAKSGRAGALDR